MENRRLLAVRASGKTAFYLPGGKLEPGEGDREALQREVKEELTVRLVPESVSRWGSVHAPAHDYPAGTTVDMSCFTADFEGMIAPAAEIEEVAWLQAADAPRCAPAVKQVIAELQRRREL
ncbi:MAG: NUDIX domain-containing protein [Candidatus Dormibacterales bacterium]